VAARNAPTERSLKSCIFMVEGAVLRQDDRDRLLMLVMPVMLDVDSRCLSGTVC
jgi:hypothetical protein